MVKMRKILGSLMMLLLAIGVFVPVAADGAEEVVSDQAILFTGNEKKELQTQAKKLEEKTGWEIFIVTTDEYYGKSTMELADDYFDERTGEEDSGFVIYIDMDVRELYFSTAGDCLNYYNDERVESILDEGYYYVSDGEYAECVEAMLEEAEHYYKKGIPDNQRIYDTETGTYSAPYRRLTLGEVATSLVAGSVIAAVIILSVIGKYRWEISNYHYDYQKYGKLDLKVQTDQFVNQTVSRRRIPRSTSSGGGSRSSVHRSSSGRSHGGGGRRF